MCILYFGGTVKLLLSDQLRDHQKLVAEEKGRLIQQRCIILNQVTTYIII